MRRLVLGISLLGFVGCEAFSAHADVVARAENAELSVDQLAEAMASSPNLPLRLDLVELLARRWVEYYVLAKRSAEGDMLMDSAMIVEAMWPDARRAVIDSFHVLLMKDIEDLSPERVDSAYRAGNIRVLAHVLRKITPESTPEEKDAARQAAVRIREELVSGGAWEEANEQNEDEASKAQGGSLGLVARGITVPRFENAAYALSPGDLSEVTETQFGFHVIYRPRLEAIREEFAAGVKQALAQRQDSVYQKGLLDSNRVEIRPNAPATIREVVRAPLRAKDSKKALAAYDDGKFVVGDLIRWLQVLPMQVHQQIDTASDEDLMNLTRSLVVQELIWRDAQQSGIEYTADTYEDLKTRYGAQLSKLRNAIGVVPDSVAALKVDGAERDQLVALAVSNYLERVLQDTRLMMPVPPFLADQLLADAKWDVNTAGVQQVMERAEALRAAVGTDSSAAVAIPPGVQQ